MRGFVFYRPSAEEPYAAAPTAVPAESPSSPTGATTTAAGLAFAHATWRQPSRPGGYVPTQSAVTPLGEPPGAVGVAASAGVAFDNCTFSNLGTPYALSVGNASKDVSVARCRFASLPAARSNWATSTTRAVSASAPTATPVYGRDNAVRDAALVRGAAAIFAAYVRAATIEHNAISNTGYTAGNRIAGRVSALNDGGCVYTLGPQPGSTLRRRRRGRRNALGEKWRGGRSFQIAQASRSASTSPPMDSPRDASDCAEPAWDRQPAEPLRLLLVRRMESRLSDSR
ncbi:hypothetical protein JL720_10869 [Aureococcus anophagefferens]|nr:hypothetical protein JL720_10869 [Aureococcus anophagefferens]